MALVIPIGYGEVGVQFKHSADPDPWYITFGVDLTEVGGDYTGAFSNIQMAVTGNLLPEVSSDVAMSGIRMTIGQDGDPLTVFVPLSGYNGTGSTDVLPQNCAALVTKITALGGRKGKGRLYMPGCLPEAQVNQIGGLSNTLHTDLGTAFDGFHADLADGPTATPMVLLHNNYGVETPDPTPVTGLSVSNTIATQRRRLR